MFSKILIANRGEIACRVIRSAKRMGIKTISVFSDADRFANHVRLSDESMYIGKSESKESYLNLDAIIKAAKETKADAIHPGYGFLSENADFVDAVNKAGICFIGPSKEAISLMGDKIESKMLADKANVSTVPGFIGEVDGLKHAQEIADSIGYPVMIKASAGGGGKGMRVANNPQQVKDSLERARSEAQSSFGDDRIFIEKLIQQPRHIEIQVLADNFGNIIHLGERECSIQRRHQKVIEEAPSPFLDESLRSSMGEKAVDLARAVNYSSAGTIEFIVDNEKNFYFLEMNTRLQVEHPVTELITGVDIVEEMIRIANGEELRLNQQEVKFSGYAIECRAYAEDPARDFVPSIGRLIKYQEPNNIDKIRVDSGVSEGSEISRFYDPMIAKVISYGSSRKKAIDLMANALDSFVIRGIRNNISFMRNILSVDSFKEGNYSTDFISKVWPDGYIDSSLDEESFNIAIAIGAFIDCKFRYRHLTRSFVDMVCFINKKQIKLDYKYCDGVCTVHIGKVIYEVTSEWVPGEILFKCLVNNVSYLAQVDILNEGHKVNIKGNEYELKFRNEYTSNLTSFMPIKDDPDLSKYLISPMPGLLIRVGVEEGQKVRKGELLVVIDAMKMENILVADKDCVVKKVLKKQNDSLMIDDIIIEFE